MTSEAQNIAIAKFCGLNPGIFAPERQYPDDPGPTFGPPRIAYWRGDKLIDVPNYCGDLNAMHEAEKRLSDLQGYEYRDNIRKLSVKHQGGKQLNGCSGLDFHAPATQRAEALLLTIGKWEKST